MTVRFVNIDMNSLASGNVIYDGRSLRNPVLSIVTVVKNDYSGLFKTLNSTLAQRINGNVEHIVWINSESANDVVYCENLHKISELFISGRDSGIFDAMNRALRYARGKYVLFLNARDIIVEEFDVRQILGPCLVPVRYIDYFGRLRFVRVSKTYKFGIPFCHQGMILPRNGYHYDTRLKYGADYLALLDFNYDWPLPMLSSGLIEYDTSGVSTVNRWESDKWTARVIRDRFGYTWASAYLGKCLLKLGIKRIYDLKCKLYGK